MIQAKHLVYLRMFIDLCFILLVIVSLFHILHWLMAIVFLIGYAVLVYETEKEEYDEFFP